MANVYGDIPQVAGRVMPGYCSICFNHRDEWRRIPITEWLSNVWKYPGL